MCKKVKQNIPLVCIIENRVKIFQFKGSGTILNSFDECHISTYPEQTQDRANPYVDIKKREDIVHTFQGSLLFDIQTSSP